MEQASGTSNQETVEGVSGLKIFFRSWRPDGSSFRVSTPTAVITDA